MSNSATHNEFRKVRKEGSTTVLSVGKLLPRGWKIVRLVKEDELPDKWVRIRIEKVA